MTEYPGREQWRQLSPDVSRDEYFRVLREAVVEFYLADPLNPYQQSGRTSGALRWEETRRLLVQAIHRSGDFLDVGCANGLLLETLIAWARQAGFVLRPHGVDFVADLVEIAQRRFPEDVTSFDVANAFYWSPRRQYDFVRTNLEYVPRRDWIPFVQRQYAAVAAGGRLILCHYRNADEPDVDVGAVLEQAGYAAAGRAGVPGTSMAWTQAPEVLAGRRRSRLRPGQEVASGAGRT